MLKTTDAILGVTIQNNSSIMITNTNITLFPTMWSQSDKLLYALFVIPQNLFNDYIPWTIIATDGTHTITNSIIINESKQYELELYYIVPPDYQAVEYIENTGSSWIDIGIGPEAGDFSVELTGAFTANTEGLLGIGGHFEIIISSGKPGMWIPASTSIEKYVTTAVPFYQLTKFLISKINADWNLSVNNQSITATVSRTTTNTYNFFRYVGGSTYYAKGRIQQCKIYNAGVLVSNTFACYRKSDGVAGMWDSVSKKFLTNAGSGTLVVGVDLI